MTGKKQELTPEQYQRWLSRHRVSEKARIDRLKLEANPIKAIPEEERVLPETYSLEEAFWHPVACGCGSCQGPVPKAIKQYRLSLRPIPPAVKSVTSDLPELPDQIRNHLQVVSEQVLSTIGSRS